jgi:hypothetical protein
VLLRPRGDDHVWRPQVVRQHGLDRLLNQVRQDRLHRIGESVTGALDFTRGMESSQEWSDKREVFGGVAGSWFEQSDFQEVFSMD